MVEKQQPGTPEDATQDSSEDAVGEWAKSLGRAIGIMGTFPNMRLLSVVEMQRRNVDTVATINRMAMAGALQVAELQYTTLLKTWDQFFTSGQNLLNGGFSRDAVAAQGESVRLASERFLADAKAFSSLIAKTNSEVSTAAKNRLGEMMEEIGQLASQTEP